MNVANVSGSAAPMAASGPSPWVSAPTGKYGNQYHAAMTAAADLLGTAPSALIESNRTQSLRQLASSKGVSEASLESAIKDGLQRAGTALSGDRLDNLAQRIANRPPHRHPHRSDAAGGGPGGGGVAPAGSAGSVGTVDATSPVGAGPAGAPAAAAPSAAGGGREPLSWAPTGATVDLLL